jgi:hypothetical protein
MRCDDLHPLQALQDFFDVGPLCLAGIHKGPNLSDVFAHVPGKAPPVKFLLEAPRTFLILSPALVILHAAALTFAVFLLLSCIRGPARGA